MEVLKIPRIKGKDRTVELVPLEAFDRNKVAPGHELHVVVADQIADTVMLGFIFDFKANGELLIRCPKGTGWPRLLEGLGLFDSPAQAAHWLKKDKRSLLLEKGFHHFWVKGVRIVVWYPRTGGW